MLARGDERMFDHVVALGKRAHGKAEKESEYDDRCPADQHKCDTLRGRLHEPSSFCLRRSAQWSERLPVQGLKIPCYDSHFPCSACPGSQVVTLWRNVSRDVDRIRPKFREVPCIFPAN